MAGFAVTPSEILGPAGAHADADIDLPTLVARQDQLAAEARAALPYAFDECTYARGALRQSVFSCLDCNSKGVCYGCSISCHAEHRLVELWTRREFTCDCPTVTMAEVGAGAEREGSLRFCSLNPRAAQPYPANEDNRYGHNFAGTFCRCGRDYDPLTEPEAMVVCIACEDWFHESCLNLQPRRTTFVDEDEDEEEACLIPSETYDGLVCCACADSNEFVAGKRGTPGWMVVVPDDGEGWIVRGREEGKQAGGGSAGATATSSEGADKPDDGSDVERPARVEEATAKRPLAEVAAPDAKRARVDDAEDEGEPSIAPAAPAATASIATATISGAARKAAGDIFLAHGVRAALAASLPAAAAAALPFPLVDAEIYEPAEDTEQEETLEQVTDRVVGALPRVQAIEAVHGYQAMKDKLKVMLAAHAEAGSTVSREDIEDFFAELRQGRAP